ncbi:MAG: hypothetical protein EAZ55_07885 [Cytophagales bacterium]|nr:MAG: hypothetical protein EAZ55_07885 [Cytophagales bacterium]
MMRKSPTAVFEVWHNHRIFSQEAYKSLITNPVNHTTEYFWAESEHFVTDEILYLSENKIDEIGRKNECLLNFFTTQTKETFLPRMIPKFFKIIQNQEGFSLISLATNSVVHGYPLRKSSYTLYNFKQNVPIRVLINTRTWHTMSSRSATQYFEYDFIYNFRGVFTEYVSNDTAKSLSQTCKNIKTIDLRKILF